MDTRYKALLDKLDRELSADIDTEELQSTYAEDRRKLVEKELRLLPVEKLEQFRLEAESVLDGLKREAEEVVGRRERRALLGNIVGAPVGGLIGYAIEPFQQIREFVGKALYTFYSNQDPRYIEQLQGPFREKFELTVDKISRLPVAVACGIAAWIIAGYIIRRCYREQLGDIEQRGNVLGGIKEKLNGAIRDGVYGR